MTEIGQGAEDVRVQRSRMLIQHALFELTVEQGFAAVTVRDIARRAQINRSTFYRHYLDKYDVLNQYLDRLQADVADAALQAERQSQSVPERVPLGLLLLIRHVQEHAAFYRVMLGKRGDSVFTYRFRQLSEQRYRHLFSRFNKTTDPREPPVEMQLQYIAYAFVGAVLWWLEHDLPFTAEQFTIWLSRLSMTTAGISIEQLLSPSSEPT